MSKSYIISKVIIISLILFLFFNPIHVFAAGISLDKTFGKNGQVITSFGNASSILHLNLQPDGKIILVGDASNGNNLDWAIARYNIDGTLDKNFNTNGKIIKDFNGYNDSLWGGAQVQPDGKIIVGGYAKPTGDYLWTLARYNSDGVMDNSFGNINNGTITTSFNSNLSVIKSIILQPDGKIIAFGYYHNNGQDDVAIVRYNSNGNLDTTFGINGIVSTPIGTSNDRGNVVILQPDGKIVAFGEYDAGGQDDTFLIRYMPNGNLDNTFGNDGIVRQQIDENDRGNDIALQPDGKIVVTGATNILTNADTFVARYNPNGTLDNTFGTNGIIIHSFSSGNDYANSLLIQSNGKIVLGGTDDTETLSGINFALMQFNNDGSIDTTFGTNGLYTTPVGLGGNERIINIALQNDKLIAAGTVSNGSYNDWGLVRYNLGNILSDFKQTDPAWSNNPNPAIGSSNYIYSTLLDHSSNCKDMYMWGCAITAVADVLKSYGNNTITVNGNSSTPIDPGSFNNWMTEKNIFSDCGAIFQYMGASVGISNPVPFWINNDPARKTAAKTMIDNALSQGNLPIVGIHTIYGTHFIALSKKLADLTDGTPDYSIIDPALYPFTAKNLDKSNTPLSTNYLWSNVYEVIVFDKHSQPTAKTISIIGHSPIQLLVTDPNQQQTGYQSTTNSYLNNISESSYGSDPGVADIAGQTSKAPESIIYNQNNPIPGIYTLQVYGTGNGPYTIDFMSMTASQSATHTMITGTAQTGKTETYLVSISSNVNNSIVVMKKIKINVLPNVVYPAAGIVGVTIMGQPGFDVKNIDINSVRLGKGEAKPIQNRGILINDKKNLLIFFNTKQAAIAQNDKQVCVTGNTKDGSIFTGCDIITVILPKNPHEQPSFLNSIGTIDVKESSEISQFVNIIKD